MKLPILCTSLMVISLAITIGNAQAASFDCSKAKSKLEKRVCSDPALGKADEQLAKAYSKALKGFIIPGFIKESQRAWLYSASYCLTAGTGDDPNGKSCVDLYAGRVAALNAYANAKVYTDYAKKYSHDGVTLLTYQKDDALWLEWFGAWMPDAYKPKPFPDGFLAQDSGKLIAKGSQFGLADHDDAIISISDEKINFGGEFGMSLSARQGPLHGDYVRVK